MQAIDNFQARYYQIFHQSKDGILVINLDGQIIDCNTRMASILGYSVHEMKKMSLFDVVDESIHYEAHRRLKEFARNIPPPLFEGIFLHKDGHKLYMEINAGAIQDSNGKVYQIQAIVRDITERKQGENALRDSEAMYKTLTNTIPDLVFTINCDNIILFVSPGEQFPYDLSNVIGKNFYDFVSDNNIDIVKKHINHVLTTGESTYYELKHETKDAIKWYMIRAGAVVESGEVVGATLVSTDITERKQYNDMILLHSQILQELGEGVNLVRASDGVITYTNTRFEVMFGYETGELIGKHASILNAPAEKSPVATAEEIIITVLTKGIWTGELYNIKKDGTPFWTFAHVTVITNSQNEQTFITVQQDITEQKIIQQKLRDSEEKYRLLNLELEDLVNRRTNQLKAKNEELDAYAYTIAHDLRAPLRHINAYTFILSRVLSGKLGEKEKQYFTQIRKSSVEMGNMIDSLLELSYIERKPIEYIPIPMHNLARSALEPFLDEVNVRNIKVEIADMPECSCDPTLLKQVYSNLISNSVKYTRSKPDARISIGFNEVNGEIIYFVQDNGIGFDKQYADQAFNVFQRLHSSDDFEGLGIGLSTVQRIIRKHNGAIKIRSKPDTGTVVCFKINGDFKTGEGDLTCGHDWIDP